MGGTSELLDGKINGGEMMTRLDLITDLVTALKGIFQGYTLLNKNKELQALEVYAQYTPQPSGVTFGNSGVQHYTESDYNTKYPCIVVKLDDMTDTEERALQHSSVKVRIITGICDWTEECTGWKAILDIQDKTRQYLLEHRVLGRKHVLRMPVVSRLIEVDTWPVYYGEMNLTYEAGRPMMNQGYIYAPRGGS